MIGSRFFDKSTAAIGFSKGSNSNLMKAFRSSYSVRSPRLKCSNHPSHPKVLWLFVPSVRNVGTDSVVGGFSCVLKRAFYLPGVVFGHFRLCVHFLQAQTILEFEGYFGWLYKFHLIHLLTCFPKEACIVMLSFQKLNMSLLSYLIYKDCVSFYKKQTGTTCP